MLYNKNMVNERLKELRKLHNKTQRDMAKYLNISQNAYCKYELGATEPNIQTLSQLADFFKCSIDILIGKDDISNDKDFSKESIELTKMFDSLSDIEKIKVKGYMQGLIDNRLTKSIQNTETKNKFNY